MKSPPQKLEGLVWGVLGIAIGLVLGAFGYARLAARDRAQGAASVAELPRLGAVTDFALTNQFGAVVTAQSLLGRPWIADIIFTRCPGPCVRMTQNLRALQQALPAESKVRIVSLTADPEFDTPAVLRRYAEQFGADLARWDFLTGPQAQIYRLATSQLMLAVGENPNPETAAPQDLFIHSTKLVLVDSQGRIRAVYDGESAEAPRQILDDLRKLQREQS